MPAVSAGALQRHVPGPAVQCIEEGSECARVLAHPCMLGCKPCSAIDQARRWLRRYLEGKARLLYPEPEDVFPCDLIDSDTCRPPSSYV